MALIDSSVVLSAFICFSWIWVSSDDLTFSIAVSKVSFASLRSRSLTEESWISG